jgi:hypothetical protein
LPVRQEATTLSDRSNLSGNGTSESASHGDQSGAIDGAVAGTKRPRPANAQSGVTAVDRQGFVALMFCDPLICSGEEQVIRMELPGTASASGEGDSSQPVLADVVVGDDGLVRAMRIVN